MSEIPQMVRDVLGSLEAKRDRISQVNPQSSSQAIAIYDVSISFLYVLIAFVESDNG